MPTKEELQLAANKVALRIGRLSIQHRMLDRELEQAYKSAAEIEQAAQAIESTPPPPAEPETT